MSSVNNSRRVRRVSSGNNGDRQSGVATGGGSSSNNKRRFLYALTLLVLTISMVDWAKTDLAKALMDSEMGEKSSAAAAGDANRSLSPSSSSGGKRRIRKSDYTHYVPAKIEDYIIENADRLGYNSPDRAYPTTCAIWRDPNVTSIHSDLHAFVAELLKYEELVTKFSTNITDLRKHLDDEDDVCDQLELHPGGLKSIFPSGQLSYSSSGFVEPLLPPMRHPKFCYDHRYLLSLGYIVHDFAAMCRQLKKTSRTVLVDMGAALDFHYSKNKPAVYLLNIFNQFGFKFDHIYAYEIRQTPPAKVFELVPEEYLSAYHWINVGVEKDPDSRLNPLKMLLNEFDEDDLIVIKLDVDTPDIEIPLAEQLAYNDTFGNLIDQFYFEHHMHIAELAGYWGSSMRGNAKASMELFSTLRKKGIPAHYWV